MLFRNELDILKDTGKHMLESIHHLILTNLKIAFWRENVLVFAIYICICDEILSILIKQSHAIQKWSLI